MRTPSFFSLSRRYWSARLTPRLIAATAMAIVIAVITPAVPVHALSGSDFQAGRIIDDSVFFNGTDMSTTVVQVFLQSKVPSCDTQGSQPYAGTTAAAYGTSRGYPPPYTCLKDYRQTTTTKPVEPGLCNGYGQASQSAAEIIAGVAQSCGINPKVLLVLLQKEQGLVTDTWPWTTQYAKATGYACPDTAACDTQYSGFFNQLYSAARQYKRYAQTPNSYNHVTNRNNSIRYSPNIACGSSTVFIQNQATAGLYNYTPYQPNQAALNNLYGTGDSCSAYGNRNFWRYYNDWFGSTTRYNGTVNLSSELTVTKQASAHMGDAITASYSVSNSAGYPVDIGGLGICARLNGLNYDFGFRNMVSLDANASTDISFTRVIDRPGILTLFLCSYNERVGGWADSFYPYSSSQLSRRQAFEVRLNPTITTGLTLSPASPTVNQAVTASFTVQNNSSSPVTIPAIGVAARDPSSANVGFPSDLNVTIAPNSTYTYSKTRTFTGNPGTYRFWVTSLRGGNWDDGWPASLDSATRSLIISITP